jgi:hypothetical protein
MVEFQFNGLCYNCDEKYFLGHKCKKHKLLTAIYEDVVDEETEVSLVEDLPLKDNPTPPFDPLEFELLISLHALTGFYSPQTLKLISYIKHRMVKILIESGSTHNFIHRHISQEMNFYIRTVKTFQIMNSNGSSMKCGELCEIVCRQIGLYHLKFHMFSIDIDGCDIVFGVK